MPAVISGSRIGRDLVLFEAVSGEQGLARLPDRLAAVLVGKTRRRLAVKHGIGLEGQLVPRQMLGLQIDRSLQILERTHHVLSGQRVHDVEVDIFESGHSRLGDCPGYFGDAMNAPEGAQAVRIETLRADRKTVDAGIGVGGQGLMFERSRVKLQRDLARRDETELTARTVEQPLDLGGGKQARRPAP